jgi:preprotein translocase subunit SecG
MTVLPLLAAGILAKFGAVLFVLISIVLILTILIQKGRGGGLSGAFGGGMASGLLGSKTGDFLTWVTIVLVAVFLTLAVLLARFFRPEVGEYGTQPPVEAGQSVPEGPTAAPQAPAPAPEAAEATQPEVPTSEAETPVMPPSTTEVEGGAEQAGEANAVGG